MKKTRIQLDLSPKAVALLDELKAKTEATSYAEVIRNAIKLYDGIIEEGGEDARLVVKREDGTTAILRLFI